MASFQIKRVKSVLLGESEPVQVRRPERLEGTLREHVPEPHGKWLLLRVGDSGRLIGGRVTLTVQIVTRVIHHVVSQVREAAGTSGRPGREPGGRTLNPCEPLLPPCPRPPLSRPRCPQSDSKSVRPRPAGVAPTHQAACHTVRCVVTRVQGRPSLTCRVGPAERALPRLPLARPGRAAAGHLASARLLGHPQEDAAL